MDRFGEAEELVVGYLRARFPDHRILAEVRPNLRQPVWKRRRVRWAAAAGLAAACLALVFLWPAGSPVPAPQ